VRSGLPKPRSGSLSDHDHIGRDHQVGCGISSGMKAARVAAVCSVTSTRRYEGSRRVGELSAGGGSGFDWLGDQQQLWSPVAVMPRPCQSRRGLYAYAAGRLPAARFCGNPSRTLNSAPAAARTRRRMRRRLRWHDAGGGAPRFKSKISGAIQDKKAPLAREVQLDTDLREAPFAR